MDTRQPKGLYIIFVTEFLDRLTYYGIQSVFVLYLTKQLLFSDASAYTVYGIYSTLAFSTPIIGGFLADKFFGYRRAMIGGMLLNLLGSIVLMHADVSFLYFGVAIVIAGIGLLKANTASLLGTLYAQHDIRKESGFTIYYLSMNAGAILGPITYGFLALQWGWKYAFVVGAVAALISFTVFIFGLKFFQTNDNNNAILKLKWNKSVFMLFGIILSVIVIILIFKFSNYFRDLLLFVGVITLIALFIFSCRQEKTQRDKIILLVILDIFAILYFTCNFQIASSLLVFIDRYINTPFLGWKLPTEAYVSLEPFFVIMTAPLFAPLWTYLEKKHHAPSVITRVILGLLLGACSFLIFSLSAKVAGEHHGGYSLFGVIFGNLVLGAGELCVGPALIAAVTYLVSQKLQGTFMGLWYLSVAFAAYLSSMMAKLSVVSTGKSTMSGNLIYSHAFLQTATLVFVAAILLTALFPYLKRLRGD